MKRLTIELPIEQYEFIRKRAIADGGTISGIIRGLIEESRLCIPDEARSKYQSDPLFTRRGSFDGPRDLARKHNQYLYGSRKR